LPLRLPQQPAIEHRTTRPNLLLFLAGTSRALPAGHDKEVVAMKKMYGIAIALIALLAAGTAFAQSQPPSWGSGGAGQMPPPPPCGQGEDGQMMPTPPPPGPPPLELIVVHFAEQIGLTADQVARIQAIADGAREEMRALHDAVRTALQSGTVADFLAADLALRDRQAQLAADVLGVLTDAQWRALQQVLPPPPPAPPAPPQG
jgi:hypothetical protein